MREIIGGESTRFYVSPYLTCRQSFEYLGGSFDVKRCQYIDEPRIRNQDFGLHSPEKTLQLREQCKVSPFYFRFPHGESGADVYDRLSAFLESMHREWQLPDRADNYVLVTHDTVLRLFLMRWFHWDTEVFKSLPRWPSATFMIMEQGADGRYKIIEHPYSDEQVERLPISARLCFQKRRTTIGDKLMPAPPS